MSERLNTEDTRSSKLVCIFCEVFFQLNHFLWRSFLFEVVFFFCEAFFQLNHFLWRLVLFEVVFFKPESIQLWKYFKIRPKNCKIYGRFVECFQKKLQTPYNMAM